jgi:excinuclease UvrABC ATPase subunit
MLSVLFGLVPLGAVIFAALGSILLGWATATEAGAMGCVGSIVLMFLYRRFKLSLVKDALYKTIRDGWRNSYLGAVAKHFGFSVLTPMKDLKPEQYNALMYGSSDRIRFSMSMSNGDAHWSHTGAWEGLLPQAERLYKQTQSEYRRHELEKFMQVSPCPVCGGKRLKKKKNSKAIFRNT